MKYKLSPLFDELASYTLNHGKVVPQEEYNFDTGMSGSDAASVNARSTVWSLKQDGLEVRVKDSHVSRSSGTYSVGWSEIDDRKLELYLNDELVVEAERCLGGGSGWSGMFSSEYSKIEPTDWQATKLDSLDQMSKRLKSLRKKYR